MAYKYDVRDVLECKKPHRYDRGKIMNIIILFWNEERPCICEYKVKQNMIRKSAE